MPKTKQKDNLREMTPLGTRSLVQVDKEQKVSEGGILIPDTADNAPMIGKVIRAGMGKFLQNGKLQGAGIKIGDRVLFSRHAGVEIPDADDKLLLINEEHIFGIVHGEIEIDENGNILKFPITGLRNIVFLKQEIKDTFEDSVIIMPETFAEDNYDGIATCIEAGAGYFDDAGIYYKSQVKKGDRVFYDKTVPWFIEARDAGGKMRKIVYCSERDVKGILA